jgi:hypothetical protein
MNIVQHNSRTTRNGGVTGAGFQPGVSGNPGGRPKGLTRRVRELVGDDGETIAKYMLSVMTDETERTADRMEAARWLSDRGWGKAIQSLDLNVEEHDPWTEVMSKLSAEELDDMIAILERAERAASA